MFASPAVFALVSAFQPHPNADLCGNDAAEDERVTVIVARLIELREKGENIQLQAKNLAIAYDYETLCTGYRRFADQRVPEDFQALWRWVAE